MSTRQAWARVSDAGWSRRLQADQARAHRYQSREQRDVTVAVMSRARALGAEGFALTGSTARRRRTAISDLDYHVIGKRPDLSDLPGDVDVVASTPTQFHSQLGNGDDFAQWTLRYGCILYDAGVMRDGVRLVVEGHLWPSSDRKLRRLTDHRREVERLVLMGDRDAAQEQVRATLTTLARGLLLRAAVFPLARSELPGQLECAGYVALARALDDVIYGEPDLAALSATLSLLDAAQAPAKGRSAA